MPVIEIRSNSANNDNLGHCFGQKNMLTEILTKISSGCTRNPSVGEFSTGILGCKNVFWSIELVQFSIASQTI
ncbi:hypothetical protein QUB36_04810 [Microcoleus sp. AT8-B1]|uniref:hypothetical protein n=1 Tax=unclassified Microcoleus TaxID=2642155 RepID=UPI002FCF5EE7